MTNGKPLEDFDYRVECDDFLLYELGRLIEDDKASLRGGQTMAADARPEQLDLFTDDTAAPGGLAAARNAAAAQRGEAPTSGPNGERLTTCRSCGAPVYWSVTAAGRRVPISVATGESHFRDCRDAKTWTKKK